MLVNAIYGAMVWSTMLTAQEPLKVEGAPSVTIAKKAGYKLKCGEPLRFSMSGPGNMHVEVRGHADTKSAVLHLVRGDKFASDTQVALAKAKDGTKDMPLYSEINFAVPAGEQSYSLTCAEAAELAFFVDAPKKAVKAHLASAEKELPPPKPAVADTSAASGEGYPFLGPTHF